MFSKLWIDKVDLMVKLNLQSTLGVLWAGLSSDGSSRRTRRRLLLRVPKAVYGHFRTVVGPRVPRDWLVHKRAMDRLFLSSPSSRFDVYIFSHSDCFSPSQTSRRL